MIRSRYVSHFSEAGTFNRVNPHLRSRSGNMLILAVFVCALIIILFECLFGLYKVVLIEELSEHAAESAALRASVDLGRIVVNDPYFGFISLSDQAPTGKATRSTDGQNHPIQGINTILGSARLQMLVAEDSGSAELIAIAEQDVEAAERASKLLARSLQFALVADTENPVYGFDADGNKVEVLEDARQIYRENLGTAFGAMPRVTDFALSLGWSDCGGWTGTPLPRPDSLAEVPDQDKLADQYKSDVDVPIGTHHFYFAGLGRQAGLIDPRHFVQADGKRTCSTVRVDVKIVVNGKFEPNATGRDCDSGVTLCASACAQPAAGEDLPEMGALAISFPNGFVPGIDCLTKLMTEKDLCQNVAQIYRAQGGDYPYDNQSCMVPVVPSSDPPSTARVFARGFHDWLRTAHCHFRIDSALDCLNMQFEQLPPDFQPEQQSGDAPAKNLFCFQFMPDGCIEVTRRNREIYQREVVTENQALSLSQVNVDSALLLLTCHDYVNSLGTINGGKHAGRALPPGRSARATQLIDYDYPPSSVLDSAPNQSHVFGQVATGKTQTWSCDPFHSGGLAVGFDIANSSIFASAR